jgi:hypothetical protein
MALVMTMAVLTPALIIGESCPHLHPCRSLLSLSRWVGWSCPMRSRSRRACAARWLRSSIRVTAAGLGAENTDRSRDVHVPGYETRRVDLVAAAGVQRWTFVDHW